MILGARRLGLGQGGRRVAHVEATNDRGGKGAGGERQRRDGRTSARGAPARRTDVGREHRQGDTDGGTSERGTPGRRGRCPCGGRRRAARLRGDRRGRGTPRDATAARVRAGPSGEVRTGGPYAREKTDAGGRTLARELSSLRKSTHGWRQAREAPTKANLRGGRRCEGLGLSYPKT